MTRFFIRISALVVYFSIIAISYPVMAQPWLKKLNNDGVNLENEQDFKEIQKAFNEYWKGKEIERGKGFKPFSRWEYMMQSRTFDDINRSAIMWDAYMEKLKPREELTEGEWNLIGPKVPPVDISTGYIVGAGRIDCIEFHPTDSLIFYIGSPTGGLWKTTDGGNTWVTLTDQLPSMGIADIAIHPQNPDTIFIATGDRDAGDVYSAGVLKSTDGGINWTTTSLSFAQSQQNIVNRLLIRPDQPDTLIAGTNNGIYLLSEAGASSIKILDGNFKDLEFKPFDPSVIYAASYSYGYSSIYRSSDGGLTFSESFTGVENLDIRRIELAVTSAEPDWVYALCVDKESSGFYGIYRSVDSGDNWSNFGTTSKNLLGTNPDGNDDGGQGWYDLALAVSPDKATEVYVGGINIWKSISTGGDWLLVSFGYPEWGVSNAPYVHVDQHILEFHPITQELYSGNDGGIYKTGDLGSSWTDLSSGLEILQIYRIGASASNSELILMGSQDNSSIRLKDSNYEVIYGGDGMECIVDYSNSNIIYASSQRGNIGISNDGGVSFNSIQPNSEDEGGWITPYILHPNNPGTIFAGYGDLYKSDNRGNSWANITSGITSGSKINAIAIAPSNTSYMYMATRSLIWRTTNNGEVWENIKNGLPQGIITYIAVSQYDPRKIWVTLSNYSSSKERNKVFTSDDAGNTWVNYSKGLPDLPANCIVFEENSNSALYVGTDLGVYYRNRDMDSWVDFSEGLPNVIVNELEIFYPDFIIRAGTYGRGLWESKLYSAGISPLFAEFSTDKYSVCVEGEIKLINHSTSTTDSIAWFFDADAVTQFSSNKDTAFVRFGQEGDKNITLIAYKNGDADTLSRAAYISVNMDLDFSVFSSSGDYFWRGDTTLLYAIGAESYEWYPEIFLSTTNGDQVSAFPNTNTTIYVTGTEGQCSLTDSIKIEVNQNNLVRYALPLDLGENGPYINFGASIEVGEPHPPLEDCNSQTDWCDEFGDGLNVLANSVWFTFQGTATGNISIDSRGFDNQIAVYDSPHPDSILVGNYSLLAANDDYNGTEFNYSAAITHISNLQSGKIYWVQVDGSGGNDEGEFYLYLYNNPLDIPKIERPEELNHFNIFPNPSSGDFSISINSIKFENAQIQVYSLQGKIVYSKNINLSGANQELQISLDNNATGLYLVKLSSESWTETRKILIE